MKSRITKSAMSEDIEYPLQMQVPSQLEQCLALETAISPSLRIDKGNLVNENLAGWISQGSEYLV